MSVYPECEIRLLNDCEPGHVVRPIDRLASGEFAMVASVPDRDARALILFQKPTPVFAVVQAAEQVRVLDYGGDWFIEIDHHGPFESSIRKLYEASGCLIREEERWLLNIDSRDRLFYQRAQIDIGRSQLMEVSGQLNHIAVFGKWTLYLGDRSESTDRWTEIFAFEYTPPEGQNI